jgi:hypothetical protein
MPEHLTRLAHEEEERLRLAKRAAVKARATAAPTFCGVPFRAHIPGQVVTSNPGNPASSTVGISGAATKCVLPVAAKTLIFPSRICGSETGPQAVARRHYPAGWLRKVAGALMPPTSRVGVGPAPHASDHCLLA